MRKGWSKKTIGLAAAACILAAGATAGSAMAYFTTYAEAEGSQTIKSWHDPPPFRVRKYPTGRSTSVCRIPETIPAMCG